MASAQHDAARTRPEDRTGPDRTGAAVDGRRSRAAAAAAAAAAATAARGVDGGVAAPGSGGGDGLWCACSEINHLKKELLKQIIIIKPTHTPQPWAMLLVSIELGWLFGCRTPKRTAGGAVRETTQRPGFMNHGTFRDRVS